MGFSPTPKYYITCMNIIYYGGGYITTANASDTAKFCGKDLTIDIKIDKKHLQNFEGHLKLAIFSENEVSPGLIKATRCPKCIILYPTYRRYQTLFKGISILPSESS